MPQEMCFSVRSSLALTISILLALALGGCRVSEKAVAKTPLESLQQHFPEKFKKLDRALTYTNAMLARVSVEEAAGYYRNKTLKNYSKAHGTQVEYHGADGRCHLWYAGYTKLFRCRWKIEKRLPSTFTRAGDKPVPHICYAYRGSDWQCRPGLIVQGKAGNVSYGLPYGPPPASVDTVTGDRFNLATRPTAPFMMEKKLYTFDQLKAGSR